MAPQFQLYTDGNSFPRAKRSGFGGYIQNSDGEIVLEFTEQVRDAQYFHSFEILGILRGLKLALDYGVSNVVSHCDDKVTYQRLREIFDDNTFAVSEAQKPELYEKVIEISKKFESVSFKYIPRQLNKKADHLSRLYAKSLEESWLSQYEKALSNSEINLERNQSPKKKAFFAHPSLLKLVHKGNPFMVAQQRSKMVRKVLRAEDKKGFNFLFIEYFEDDDNCNIQLDFRLYSEKKEHILSIPFSKSFETSITEFDRVDFFHNSLRDTIHQISQQFTNINKLWINSNDDHIMSYTEQCEKIPSKNWEVFQDLYHTLDSFDKIVFHHLPFDVDLVICPAKIEEQTLSDDQKWDTMLHEYHQINNTREKRRKFGQLICHTLKTMKKNGEDVTDNLVNEVIQKLEKRVNIKPSKKFI